MAESLFHDASRTLQDAIQEKNIGEMTAPGNSKFKMSVARQNLEECKDENECHYY